jgi:hypothetical protein
MMRSNANLILTFCFGAAFALLAGSALAGTTTATAIAFARELGQANQVYVIPAGITIIRGMGIARTQSQDLFLDVTLVGGATFSATGGGALPDPGNVTMTGAPASFTITKVGGGYEGSSSVRFFVNVLNLDMQQLGVATIAAGGWGIMDPTNVLGGGGSFGLTVSTADPSTNVPLDIGADTVANWITGSYATNASLGATTTATIDVSTNRKNFVPNINGNDTLTIDKGATLSVNTGISGVYDSSGVPYHLTSASKVNITIAGDLTGITSFNLGPVTLTVSANDRAAGSAAFAIFGNNIADPGQQSVWINVDGTTSLSSRAFSVAVGLQLGGPDGVAANNRTLLFPTILSTWSLNGTILISNYVNGNNGSLQSRLYLHNPASAATADVIARVFTLPLSGGTNAQVGNTVTVGALKPGAGINLRLAEDILTPAGVTLPYTADGGNLFVEFTIQANNVSGVSQTFVNGGVHYFGVYNLTSDR